MGRLRLVPIALTLAGAVFAYAAALTAGPLGAAAAAAAAGLGSWALADALFRRPAFRLARALRTTRESPSVETASTGVRADALGELTDELDALLQSLQMTRREAGKAAAAEAARIDAQKAWLEAVLQGLSEGVFVCSRQHRIMLYNRAAVELTGAPERVGLGRSLGEVLGIAPFRHSLARLEGRQRAEGQLEVSAPFVCRVKTTGAMLHGRMALLCDHTGAISGYLVTLVDISAELRPLARGEGVLQALGRDVRARLASLRAAADALASLPEAAEERRRLAKILQEDSAALPDMLDRVGREIRGHILGRWPMADIDLGDLALSLERALADDGISLRLSGGPFWLHGDSVSLLAALEMLVRRLAREQGTKVIDVQPALVDERIRLDLVCQGAPISSEALDTWLDAPAGHSTGVQRVRDVLGRHGCAPASIPGPHEGSAILRLSLPAPDRAQRERRQERLPARPEFYDFGLMREHQGDAALASRKLAELDFVVFDCEMTGLRPLHGDEIIQIGAVRVVGGRILRGETFERLVNPGRPIPPASIRFHGITDAEVAGKPHLREVLPAFRSFVADAVMVGHNVAFDMKFLTLREREAGVSFDNPVLDTMLVSTMLDPDEDDHSLDRLCERYNIPITGRHTAVGDALATAEVLLTLCERLETRNLSTFGAVMKASDMAAQLRHRGAVAAAG